MHLDPITGLWKNDDNDYRPSASIESELDEILAEKSDEVGLKGNADPPLNGSCVLSIRFETRKDYLRWKCYFEKNRWDFVVTYPAILRAEYEFHNSLEAEVLAKKIVQLLQAGFDVYSASWKLEKGTEHEADLQRD